MNDGNLNRYNADGTVDTLATTIGTNFSSFGIFPTINDSGVVAAKVSKADDNNNVVAFEIRRFGGTDDDPGTGTLIEKVGNPAVEGDLRAASGTKSQSRHAICRSRGLE